MKNFNIKVEYKTTTEWKEITGHGLLLAAWQFGKQCGAFKEWEKIKYKMKKVRYSPIDKLKTLWTSIVVGCNHTVEINDKLGKHEQSLARAIGLGTFPDQSQIDRLLLATNSEQV